VRGRRAGQKWAQPGALTPLNACLECQGAVRAPLVPRLPAGEKEGKEQEESRAGMAKRAGKQAGASRLLDGDHPQGVLEKGWQSAGELRRGQEACQLGSKRSD
jgi:hypothetical protein